MVYIYIYIYIANALGLDKFNFPAGESSFPEHFRSPGEDILANSPRNSLHNFLELNVGELPLESLEQDNEEIKSAMNVGTPRKQIESENTVLGGHSLGLTEDKQESSLEFKAPLNLLEYRSSSNSCHSSDEGVAKVLCPAPRRALQKRMSPSDFAIPTYTEKVRSARGIGTLHISPGSYINYLSWIAHS